MIIVATKTEQDTSTGKPQQIVTHGIDEVTRKSVALPERTPQDVGAQWDADYGEFVIH